jgi:hypothetical protein
MNTHIFDKLLTFTRYIFTGRRNDPLPLESVPRTLLKESEGFNGPLGADALLLSEDDKIILSVDYFFSDIPSWLEWDSETSKLGIVQMGGAIAELNLEVPKDNIIDFEKAKKVLLVTRKGQKRLESANDQRLVHAVNLIVRK